MRTVRGDGVTGIKRRRRDQYGDSVRNLTTTSRRGRLKGDLESSTWHQVFGAAAGDLIVFYDLDLVIPLSP
ncbi:hypothetical protein Tco_0625046, partial [Tanacetum coccineum]